MPPHPLLKIEGPPGSGKTLELAREAVRLMVQEGIPASKILLLTMSELGKKRLTEFSLQEARQAGLSDPKFKILTVDAWLLGWLQAIKTPHKPQILKDSNARAILQNIVQQEVPLEHPLYYSGQTASFSRVVFDTIRQWQLQNQTPEQILELASQTQDPDSILPLLGRIYKRFQEKTSAANLVCYADLANQLLHYCVDHATESPMHRSHQAWQAILVDEAQELSEAHNQLLAFLPAQLVLAGNENLSIRRFRGAAPEEFASLASFGDRPATLLPQLACLRGNEPILSLLNGFLAQTLWEEHHLDQERLQTLVAFGLHEDPTDEARQVVRHIQHFVSTAQVEDRPARWDDCVVLLRSSHYKNHLTQAFWEAGVPFQSSLVTEQTLHVQHYLYDWLNILSGWQKLQITIELLQQPEALLTHLQESSMPSVEKQHLLETIHRHWLRWMEARLSEDMDSTALQALHQHFSNEENTLDGLWQVLLEPEKAAPEILAHMKPLYQSYESLIDDFDPLNLLTKMMVDIPVAPQHAEAVQLALSTFQTHLIQLNQHYQGAIGHPIPLSGILSHYSALWEDSDEAQTGQAALPSKVRLMSVHQAQGETFPFAIVPFMVQDEWPQTRHQPELFPDNTFNHPDDSFSNSLANRPNEAEEVRLLAVAMSRASQQLILSAHRSEQEAPIQPSAFYVHLLREKRRLLGQTWHAELCSCKPGSPKQANGCLVDFCSGQSAPVISPLRQTEHLVDPNSIELDSWENNFWDSSSPSRYDGTSLWATLTKSQPESLFDEQEALTLSASAIKTYMTCPRQFYYRHLLGLRPPANEAATLGTLIHRVMEVFNRQAAAETHNLQQLLAITERFFGFSENPDAFYEAGFEAQDARQLASLSALSLSSLQERLMDALQDLAQKGYFERYRAVQQVQAEKKLEAITLKGIERCRFRGTVDAMVQLANGDWEIIDYKTYRNAYKAQPDTCEKRFQETLTPLPESAELSHSERFADKLKPDYPKDYQLPLYYLACSQNPEYRGHLKGVAMQIIRPAFPNNPEQGSISLHLEAQDIEQHRDTLISDIKQYIIEPLLGSSTFSAEPNPNSCGYCSYFNICDAATNGQEEGDA